MTHVKSMISPQDLSLSRLARFPFEENWMDAGLHQQGRPNGMRHNHFNFHDQKFICYRCGTSGHKSTYC